MLRNRLIILRGLPGSGKSTYLKQLKITDLLLETSKFLIKNKE